MKHLFAIVLALAAGVSSAVTAQKLYNTPTWEQYERAIAAAEGVPYVQPKVVKRDPTFDQMERLIRAIQLGGGGGGSSNIWPSVNYPGYAMYAETAIHSEKDRELLDLYVYEKVMDHWHWALVSGTPPAGWMDKANTYGSAKPAFSGSAWTCAAIDGVAPKQTTPGVGTATEVTFTYDKFVAKATRTSATSEEPVVAYGASIRLATTDITDRKVEILDFNSATNRIWQYKRDKVGLQVFEPQNEHWTWSTSDANAPDGWLSKANAYAAAKPTVTGSQWSCAPIGDCTFDNLTADAKATNLVFTAHVPGTNLTFTATANRLDATNTVPVLVHGDERLVTTTPFEERWTLATNAFVVATNELHTYKRDKVGRRIFEPENVHWTWSSPSNLFNDAVNAYRAPKPQFDNVSSNWTMAAVGDFVFKPIAGATGLETNLVFVTTNGAFTATASRTSATSDVPVHVHGNEWLATSYEIRRLWEEKVGTNDFVTATNDIWAAMGGGGAARVLPEYLWAFDFYDPYIADAEWYCARIDDLGACSSVRRGNAYLRNFDWTYDESITAVIRMSGVPGRFASVGVANVGTNLTEKIVKSGEWSRFYRCLPGMLTDGINEKGVVANINVVSTNGAPWESHADGDGRNLNILMAVRHIMDSCETASNAAVHVASHAYVPKSIQKKGMSIHLMVADETETWIVEDGVASNVTGTAQAMTNFRVLSDEDPYGTGYERYDMLAAGSPIEDAYFRKGYERPFTRPTEFAGSLYTNELGQLHLLTHTETNLLLACAEGTVPTNARAGLTRNGKSWQTVHSSAYDILKRQLAIAVQEGTDRYVFGVPSTGGSSDGITRYEYNLGTNEIYRVHRHKNDLTVYEPKKDHWTWEPVGGPVPEDWLWKANYYLASRPTFDTTTERWFVPAPLGGVTATNEVAGMATNLVLTFLFDNGMTAKVSRVSATSLDPVMVHQGTRLVDTDTLAEHVEEFVSATNRIETYKRDKVGLKVYEPEFEHWTWESTNGAWIAEANAYGAPKPQYDPVASNWTVAAIADGYPQGSAAGFDDALSLSFTFTNASGVAFAATASRASTDDTPVVAHQDEYIVTSTELHDKWDTATNAFTEATNDIWRLTRHKIDMEAYEPLNEHWFWFIDDPDFDVSVVPGDDWFDEANDRLAPKPLFNPVASTWSLPGKIGKYAATNSVPGLATNLTLRFAFDGGFTATVERVSATSTVPIGALSHGAPSSLVDDAVLRRHVLDCAAATNEIDRVKRDKDDYRVWRKMKDCWTWTSSPTAAATNDAPADYLAYMNSPSAKPIYFIGSVFNSWYGGNVFWPDGKKKYFKNALGPSGTGSETNLQFEISAYDRTGTNELYRFGAQAVRQDPTNETLVSWSDKPVNEFIQIATTDLLAFELNGKVGTNDFVVATNILENYKRDKVGLQVWEPENEHWTWTSASNEWNEIANAYGAPKPVFDPATSNWVAEIGGIVLTNETVLTGGETNVVFHGTDALSAFTATANRTSADSTVPVLVHGDELIVTTTPFEERWTLATNAFVTATNDLWTQKADWTLDVNTNWTALTVGDRNTNFTVGAHSVVLGTNGAASAAYARAGGFNAVASNAYSVAWQGVVTNLPYGSHGDGTVSLNPVGGAEGVWIGETNLATFLDEKFDKRDVLQFEGTNRTAVMSQQATTHLVKDLVNEATRDKVGKYEEHVVTVNVSDEGELVFSRVVYTNEVGSTIWTGRPWLEAAADPDTTNAIAHGWIVQADDVNEAVCAKSVGHYIPNGALEGSLVYLCNCYSGYDETLANAFLAKGAAAVVGHTELTQAHYGDAILYSVAARLASTNAAGVRYTLAEAVDYATDLWGHDDKVRYPVQPGSRPRIFGDANYRAPTNLSEVVTAQPFYYEIKGPYEDDKIPLPPEATTSADVPELAAGLLVTANPGCVYTNALKRIEYDSPDRITGGFLATLPANGVVFFQGHGSWIPGAVTEELVYKPEGGADVTGKRDKDDLKVYEPKNDHWTWVSTNEAFVSQANVYRAPKPQYDPVASNWLPVAVGGYDLTNDLVEATGLETNLVYSSGAFTAEVFRVSATNDFPVLVHGPEFVATSYDIRDMATTPYVTNTIETYQYRLDTSKDWFNLRAFRVYSDAPAFNLIAYRADDGFGRHFHGTRTSAFSLIEADVFYGFIADAPKFVLSATGTVFDVTYWIDPVTERWGTEDTHVYSNALVTVSGDGTTTNTYDVTLTFIRDEIVRQSELDNQPAYTSFQDVTNLVRTVPIPQRKLDPEQSNFGIWKFEIGDSLFGNGTVPCTWEKDRWHGSLTNPAKLDFTITGVNTNGTYEFEVYEATNDLRIAWTSLDTLVTNLSYRGLGIIRVSPAPQSRTVGEDEVRALVAAHTPDVAVDFTPSNAVLVSTIESVSAGYTFVYHGYGEFTLVMADGTIAVAAPYQVYRHVVSFSWDAPGPASFFTLDGTHNLVRSPDGYAVKDFTTNPDGYQLYSSLSNGARPLTGVLTCPVSITVTE